ncbi:hypothetical protein U1Q18_049825, partial [Sarracenia purpurea var. burkii]
KYCIFAKMETCVLIPQELSLVISGQIDHKRKYPSNISVNVWTNVTISKGTLIRRFKEPSGSINWTCSIIWMPTT